MGVEMTLLRARRFTRVCLPEPEEETPRQSLRPWLTAVMTPPQVQRPSAPAPEHRPARSIYRSPGAGGAQSAQRAREVTNKRSEPAAHARPVTTDTAGLTVSGAYRRARRRLI